MIMSCYLLIRHGIPEILKSCDIYLTTSLFEGLSNSIMEAMVAGLPVVVTDVGDARYLVKDGYNGFLVRCRDVDSISDKLDFLSNNESARKDFGERSHRISLALIFQKDKLIDNYMELISELSSKTTK